MESIVALQKGAGWKAIQLDKVTKLQKSWKFKGEEYRVDVFFGRLFTASSTPVVIMNAYRQGAGTSEVIDENCDAWKNFFTSTTEHEGNEYYRYLKKHGFRRV